MNLVVLHRGGYEVALDASAVDRFDGEDGDRRVHTRGGAAVTFDRARLTAVDDAALVPLPSLLDGLRHRVGARAVVLTADDRATLLIAPDVAQAATLAAGERR